MRERIRAFGYERVSGRSQVEGYGFDRQEETILNYAKKAGYEIVHIFREEAISGTKDQEDRPAFQDMVAEILKDGVRPASTGYRKPCSSTLPARILL
jgi:DNA invertase Pin-like site-specific DNA recombinase